MKAAEAWLGVHFWYKHELGMLESLSAWLSVDNVVLIMQYAQSVLQFGQNLVSLVAL